MEAQQEEAWCWVADGLAEGTVFQDSGLVDWPCIGNKDVQEPPRNITDGLWNMVGRVKSDQIGSIL